MTMSLMTKITGVSFLGALIILAASTVWADTASGLLPVGDGAYKQFADIPKAGSEEYVEVDEAVCDGTATYLKAGNNKVGKRSSVVLDLSSIPDGSTISAITVYPCASRNSKRSGTSVMDLFYRLDGINSVDAGNYQLPAGVNVPTEQSPYTFTNLSIVKDSTTTLEIGVVYTSGNRGVRVSRLTADIEYSVPNPVPADPSALSATASSTNVTLTWTDNANNEDGFKIDRDSGSGFTQIDTVGANVTSYADSSLSDGTYTYRVRATNATGDSGYSNAATAIVNTATVPVAPSNLSANASSSLIAVYWADNSGNEDYFDIERGLDGVNFSLLATSTWNLYYDYSVSASTTYYYRARAVNSVGSSGYSNTDSATAY